MSVPSDERRAHWQSLYQSRRSESVSWYRPHLDLSLDMLTEAGLCTDSRLIDIGGGASTLVDDLLERGVRSLTVLDVSHAALSVAQRRLGSRASAVKWHTGDVLQAALPANGFDFWHDRAVLHFLTDVMDTQRYAQIASNAVASGGHALISGFAPDGPERCSGLPVARRSASEIAALLAPAFELVRSCAERHRTPEGSEQSFAYVLLRRRQSTSITTLARA
jgi:2-polyprenyl-3-methyl-5-hydroxy-6-metoxy-1,4-benzoquinol methylase